MSYSVPDTVLGIWDKGELSQVLPSGSSHHPLGWGEIDTCVMKEFHASPGMQQI